MLRYDTVLLDADGTLFDFHRSEREAVWEALCRIGVTPTETMLADYSRINDSLWKKLERGEIEKKVLFYHRFELLFEQYGISADARGMAEDYMNRLSQKGYLLDGAEKFCAILRKKCRLYIVTNGTEFIQHGRFRRCGLAPYFDDVFISDAIGAEKPDLRFFAYVASHIPDFDLRKTLIVGDSLTSDMQGGIAYGLDTCWYNPHRQEIPTAFCDKLTYVAEDYTDVCHAVGVLSENEVL